MTRRLALRKESLAPLSDGELSEVAGGDAPTFSCVPCVVKALTEAVDWYSVRNPTACCPVVVTSMEGSGC